MASLARWGAPAQRNLAGVWGFDLDMLLIPLSLAVTNGAPALELLGPALADDLRQQARAGSAVGTAAAPESLPSASTSPAIPPLGLCMVAEPT